MGSLSPPALFWFGAGLLLLLLVFANGSVRPAAAFGLNAYWQHSLSGGDEAETRSSLQQTYRANDGISLDISRAMAANAAVSYNRTQFSGKGITELLTPTATFQVSNDIFRVGLSGTATRNRRTDAAGVDTSRWRTTLAPGSYPWSRTFWPGLSVYYGESQTSSSHLIDSHESTYGGNMSLQLPRMGRLFYGYDGRRRENRISQRVTETATQFGRFDTNGNFWDDRLVVKFSQSVRQESTTNSGIVPVSGVVELEPQVTFAYYSLIDAIDPNFDARNFPLSAYGNSVLGNLENTNTIDLGPQQNWYLGVSPVFAPGGEQQVDRLRVYVDDPFGELVTASNVLQWDLYASLDNATWDPVAQNVTATYSSVDQRFEVDIPALNQDYQFLMVVVSNRSNLGVGTTVKIRAVDAIPLRRATAGSSYSNSSSSTSYTTNADLKMEVSSTLTATSNINLVYGADFFNGFVRGDIRWTPSPIVSPSLGFSETRRSGTGIDESIFRTYSLSVPVTVLPTFNVSLGGTRTDQFSGGERQSARNSMVLAATATLYPDLTASLVETYNTGTRVESDGSSTENEDFGSGLDLKAQLTPKLTCEVSNFYHKTLKPQIRAESTYYSTFNFYYRPSDPLSLELRLQKNWIGNAADSVNSALNLALLTTRKTRLNLTSQYRHTEQQIDQKFFGLSGSWDISRIFTMKGNAGYSIAATKSWSITTSLYMRL